MIGNVKILEIYRLPDGKDYFAARGPKNAYFLYLVENCAKPPIYEITSEGLIKHWQTNENSYPLTQLKETGRKFDCFNDGQKIENVLREPQPKSLFLMMLDDFFYGGNTTSE